jgi:N-acetylglutamate synthase-like GNAT family acetyltransferase
VIAALCSTAVAEGKLVARDLKTIRGQIHEFVLAERNEQVTAVMGLGERGDDLLVYNLCVGPGFQGHGVGTALLDHAVTHAGVARARAVIAFAPADDTWFPKRGFRRVGDAELAPLRARLRAPGRTSVLYERLVADRSRAPAR